jgi:hypothetical protein
LNRNRIFFPPRSFYLNYYCFNGRADPTQRIFDPVRS